MATAVSGTISQDQYFQPLRNLPVFIYRIGVHNLGVQVNPWSENHVTLYLLVGSGQSVRVDMRPRSGQPCTDLIGTLDLRGHSYTRSQGIIQYVDVQACGHQAGFNPEGRRPLSTSRTRRVWEVIQLLQERGLHNYRFLDVNGSSLGCRYWMFVSLCGSITSRR